MKRFFALLCVVCLLMGVLPGALADHQYLLDSDVRRITEAELWEWDRESLSFMFNEIFARYGFTFDPGGLFYNWFNSQPWYKRTPKVDDQTAYDVTTALEWDNYETIKKVIREMERVGHPYRKSPGSHLKSWLDYQPPGNWTLTGFEYVDIKAGQKLPVYSAPSQRSYRANNSKALTNTNGAIWAAGWENNWLLIFYELNNGGLRVGYVDGDSIKGSIDMSVRLQFAFKQVAVLNPCNLTDDPLQKNAALATLNTGDTVTYLTTVINQNGQAWDYVETIVEGKTARGFLPSGSVEVPVAEMPDIQR